MTGWAPARWPTAMAFPACVSGWPRWAARSRPVRARPVSPYGRPSRSPRDRFAKGTPMTISVLLADDQHLVRAGFRSLLRRDRDIAVVGEASTGDEAVRTARELHPDVILMDIRMPGLDGIAATRKILAEIDTKVIILTTFETDEYVFAALAAG